MIRSARSSAGNGDERAPASVAGFRAPLAIGMLSWGARKTLRATLEALRREDIFSLFDEKVIFFQEIAPADREIAAEYGLEAEGDPRNLGIMGGMESIARCCRSKYVLHVENDMRFVADRDATQALLRRAVEHLEERRVDCYRLTLALRSDDEKRRAESKFLRYHSAPSLGIADDARRKARRLLRPGKARRLVGRAVVVDDAPHERFPRWIRSLAPGHWAVDSAVINWSNQTPLYPREWFLRTILPAAKARFSSRPVNGCADLEKELNGRWWRRRGFRVGVCRGLFTHSRVDRPSGDEKANPG